MKLHPGWILALAGLAGLAALYGLGYASWAFGLALGLVLGAVTFSWIRFSVRRAFASRPDRADGRRLLVHSVLRLALVAAVLVAALRFREIEIWGVVLGYTLVHLPASLWQGRAARKERGPA